MCFTGKLRFSLDPEKSHKIEKKQRNALVIIKNFDDTDSFSLELE